ncbi:hypothetical protein EDC04DRAFT_2834440 [Pisolithus marmoratus]|nr:hypothetical protein EDC04DRAFT_2834440 [Pisolithus marmoratus]
MQIGPINRLPTELLLRAFQFHLEAAPDTCDVYRHGKRFLASVSRRWRDVILHSPSLWTTIKVTSYCSEARAKTYVSRSSQSLLNIHFYSSGHDQGTFTAILNVLAACAHRWCSLIIRNDISSLHKYLILEKLNHLSFPSLKRVSFWGFPGSFLGQAELSQLIFLHPESSPHLEHLHLPARVGQLVPSHIRSGLSTLSLSFHVSHPIRHPSLFESPSFQGLTSLHVTDYSANVICDLLPNSIQLPLLEKFVCGLQYGKALIHALVAPKLKHFEYCPSSHHELASALFAGLNSRFNNVDYLRLSEFTTENLSETVCLAFPNVCHLELVPAKNSVRSHRVALPSAVPLWNNLKSLTLQGLRDTDFKFLSSLASWFELRLNGQPKLRVKIVSYQSTISSLFRRLHKHCHLELSDDFCTIDKVLCQSQAWEVLRLPFRVTDKFSATTFVTGYGRSRNCCCGAHALTTDYDS